MKKCTSVEEAVFVLENLYDLEREDALQLSDRILKSINGDIEYFISYINFLIYEESSKSLISLLIDCLRVNYIKFEVINLPTYDILKWCKKDLSKVPDGAHFEASTSQIHILILYDEKYKDLMRDLAYNMKKGKFAGYLMSPIDENENLYRAICLRAGIYPNEFVTQDIVEIFLKHI